MYRPSEAVSFGAARFGCGISKTPSPIPVSEDDGYSTEASELTTTSESNDVMEQLTDCCYGIFMTSEGKLKGEVKFIVQSGERRPSTSQKIVFDTVSPRVIVKIYRSKVKNKRLESAAIEECDSVLWVPFDVEPGSTCEVTIIVLENYGLEIELRTNSRKYYKKTTSDDLSKLL
jgi:hypothetical protein